MKSKMGFSLTKEVLGVATMYKVCSETGRMLHFLDINSKKSKQSHKLNVGFAIGSKIKAFVLKGSWTPPELPVVHNSIHSVYGQFLVHVVESFSFG